MSLPSLEDRRKAAKKRYRKELAGKVLLGVLGFLAIVGVVAAVIALGGLIFWAAWNWGVVNLVAAAGGSVASINFLTACGGSLAVGILSRIFRRAPAVSAEAKG